MTTYGKIELEPRIEADDDRKFSTPESLQISVQKNLSFWEDYDCDTEVFEGVVVDTAGTPLLLKKDIPIIIEFLNKVLERNP